MSQLSIKVKEHMSILDLTQLIMIHILCRKGQNLPVVVKWSLGIPLSYIIKAYRMEENYSKLS